MKLSNTIKQLLNDQYRHESRNHWLYKQRQSWCDFRGLTGCAAYFKQEAAGEYGHAEIVLDYILDRNEELKISPFMFDAPDLGNDATLLSLFETALDVEYGTTAALQNIYTQACAEGDYMTAAWLFDKLIPAQVDEENEYQTIIDRFGMYAQAPARDTDMDAWIKENLVK
jgi:ferritin